MASRRGDDHGSLGDLLVADIGEVELRRPYGRAPGTGLVGVEGTKALEPALELGDAAEPERLGARGGGIGGVRRGHELDAHVGGEKRVGRRAARRYHLSLEAHLTDEEGLVGHPRRDLARGHQDGDGDWKVEPGPGLPHVAGDEVDVQARPRDVVAAVAEGAPDTRRGLAHRAVDAAREGEPGHAAAGRDLDRDRDRLHPAQERRMDARDRGHQQSPQKAPLM